MQTIVWRGRRGNWEKSEDVWSNQWFGHHSLDSICPDLQRVGPSMMCNMLGERSWKSCNWWFWEISPHTYSCICFYSKGKQRWKQQGLYRFWTPASLNFIQIKSEKCLKHQFFLFFFWEFGLSPGSALFMVASSTMGVHLAAINGDVVPSFTTIYWFIIVQAARLVHKYNYEPWKDIMIRETKHNHPKGR